MRALAALLPLAIAAAPAAAAEPPRDSEFAIPPELTDPAMAETLGKMLGAVTRAMMDVPVGELQAAVQGREPTPGDKARTVRDFAGNDPNIERRIERQVAEAVPRLQASLKAMAKSLPAMARAMEKVADDMEGSMERATANLPQPGYPRR